jgi:hypothetical protein
MIATTVLLGYAVPPSTTKPVPVDVRSVTLSVRFSDGETKRVDDPDELSIVLLQPFEHSL